MQGDVQADGCKHTFKSSTTVVFVDADCRAVASAKRLSFLFILMPQSFGCEHKANYCQPAHRIIKTTAFPIYLDDQKRIYMQTLRSMAGRVCL